MGNVTKDNKSNKTAVIAVICFIAVIVVVAAVYFLNRPATQKGAKTITVEVVDGEGKSEDFVIHTDAEYLRQAIEEAGIVGGNESDYGLWVTTMNGIKADDSKQEWWCFTKGGAMVETGVDTTPVADGDHFEATLTAGY